MRLPHLDRDRPPGIPGLVPSLHGVFSDGWFLASSMGSLDVGQGPGERWMRSFLIRVHPEASQWDTLGDFGRFQRYWTGTDPLFLPFGGLGLEAVGPDGLFFGDGQAFEVGEYDRQGSLQRIIRWSGEREPVTDEDIAEFEEWWRRANSASRETAPSQRVERYLATLRPSETKPAYSWILVDAEGNLWVEEFRWMVPDGRRPYPEPVHWNVFSSEGIWLGRVETPPGLLLRDVGSDYVLGISQDDFDVKHIRIFDLIKE